MRTRSGQAMIELALGLFVFALVVCALLSFGAVIPESLRLQGMVRRIAGREAQTAAGGANCGSAIPAVGTALSDEEVQPLDVSQFTELSARPVELVERSLSFETDIDDFAAEWLYGEKTFRGAESASMPTMTIPNFAADGFVQ